MSQDYQDYGQQEPGWMPHDPSQQPPGQQGQGPLAAAKQIAYQQISQAIDEFASNIPGGQQLAQPAKKAVSGILDEMEKAASTRMGGMFGGGQPS
jgi:hypothetical protein